VGAFLAGLTFAVAWTPCVGPILGMILTLAGAVGKASTGMLMLFAYSMGLAIPFFLGALALNRFLTLFDRYKGFLPVISTVSGLLMMAVGGLLVTDYFTILARMALEFTPAWLLDPAGAACGRLEDTRRAKRLFGNDGSELVSAHLSCFAFSEVAAGAALLWAAARRAAGLGYPALFVAVAEPDAEAMLARLGNVRLTVAPATVYGAGLKAAIPWNINTAEI